MKYAVPALALHVVLGLLVAGEGPQGVDRAAADAAADVEGQTALDVVRVLTEVGSFPVTALLVGITALFAARVRDVATARGLVLAAAALYVTVHLGKELWDRPRPRGFYEPSGLAYPSGHAAYATAWLAAATLTGRRALIVLAAALVVAVGASRVYLGVHYLTDVVGGIALGAAAFLVVLARR